ncbi:hypothetical protein NDU88_000815 [Pleurodeles waltl]|uniref:Uncharacterized protein n=1 Tax=Pleurodeles waltl TaxID=8319 RepID=A0AAV7N947_PLEWA|nr:hypothetical protein NDU88_000815 [Pleurodeles waltl]
MKKSTWAWSHPSTRASQEANSTVPSLLRGGELRSPGSPSGALGLSASPHLPQFLRPISYLHIVLPQGLQCGSQYGTGSGGAPLPRAPCGYLPANTTQGIGALRMALPWCTLYLRGDGVSTGAPRSVSDATRLSASRRCTIRAPGPQPPLQSFRNAARGEASSSPPPRRPDGAAHCTRHTQGNALGPKRQIPAGPVPPQPLSARPAAQGSHARACPTTLVPDHRAANQSAGTLLH